MRSGDPETLRGSIIRRGLTHPIVLLLKDDKFETVARQRRFVAARELGWKVMPTLMFSLSKPHIGKILSAYEISPEDIEQELCYSH